MRHVLTILLVWLANMAAYAQIEDDFASRFMQSFENDTTVVCVTVSPKMMEQLTDHPKVKDNEEVKEALKKLKGLRIIKADSEGQAYYGMATELLEGNKGRFEHVTGYVDSNVRVDFYARADSNGETEELIMLHASLPDDKLQIVDLTGDLDEEFIDVVTKYFAAKPLEI